jgi:hypothetical protein
MPQADFLAPDGYEAVYRTNAYTKHGEHGNAMLTRWPVVNHQHEDMSITGLNSVACCMCELQWRTGNRACGGGAFGADPRQPRRVRWRSCKRYIAREIPAAEPLLIAG